MKKLMVAALALGVLALGSTANAQIEPMEIGIFGSADGSVANVTSALPNVPFNYYVVAGELPPIKAFSFNINHPVAGFMLSVGYFGPGPLDVEGGDNNRAVVGTGGCIDAPAGAALASYNFFPSIDLTGTVMCLTGDATSTTNMPEVAYCDDTIVAMGLATTASYGDGCNAINGEAPVANETSSFGNVKANF